MYLGCTAASNNCCQTICTRKKILHFVKFFYKILTGLARGLDVAVTLDMLKVTIESSSSCQQVEKLTGSTADTFLEYIQRNLPEGVAMKVTKVCDYFFHFIKAI